MIVNVHMHGDTPGVSHRTFGNRTQSNLIELNRTIEFDLVPSSRTKSNSQKKFVNRTKSNVRLVRPSNEIELAQKKLRIEQ